MTKEEMAKNNRQCNMVALSHCWLLESVKTENKEKELHLAHDMAVDLLDFVACLAEEVSRFRYKYGNEFIDSKTWLERTEERSQMFRKLETENSHGV